jgi:hypothetical protein
MPKDPKDMSERVLRWAAKGGKDVTKEEQKAAKAELARRKKQKKLDKKKKKRKWPRLRKRGRHSDKF